MYCSGTVAANVQQALRRGEIVLVSVAQGRRRIVHRPCSASHLALALEHPVADALLARGAQQIIGVIRTAQAQTPVTLRPLEHRKRRQQIIAIPQAAAAGADRLENNLARQEEFGMHVLIGPIVEVQILFVQPAANALPDLIAHLAEFCQFVFVRPFERRRIVKSPTQPLADIRKDRALVIRVGTDGDDVAKVQPAHIFIHVFGPLACERNTDFLHHAKGKGMDALGLQPGAMHFKVVAGIMAEKRFRHLAARRVAGAEKQHSGLEHVPISALTLRLWVPC